MLLNCHTAFSFCYGTLKTEELLQAISAYGYHTFALTDINNTSACLETIRTASKYGLKPIAGIDFRNGVARRYVGIAQNNEGFRELNEHLTKHLHASEDFSEQAPPFLHSWVVYPLREYAGWALRENEFIGVSIQDLPRLPFSPAKHMLHKMVALQPVTFIQKQHFNTHRLLRAIGKNTLLSKLPAAEQSTAEAMLLPREKLYAAYSAFPRLIENAEYILQNSGISFEYGKLANKNKKHFTGSVAGDLELLRTEAEKGLSYRYGTPSAKVEERLKKELDLIAQMNFSSYYLINWDIVKFAREKLQCYYVGRGSGANSMVAYLLRITDVDPIDLDLYFERFINPFRANAPDFDIDFSWRDRDAITEYIFKTHGTSHTALLGSYATYKHDAAIRELGKVFGLPANEIDRLQATEKESTADELGRLVLRYSRLIKDLPSHLSIHASGIIISEKPVSCYTATILPPKGYPTTQFSMLEAEDIGLFKFDILSQRGLGKIKDALEIVRENAHTEIDIHNLVAFKADERVKSLLSQGKCIGCFYIESPAMRMLLSKLQADDYLRLVAASSIIRPGVAQSGMMREYILRYRDPARREKARAALPELYNILEETYGVMVYQEDVIKVAHYFAGLTLAEADYLRRGMSWKFKERNEFSRVKEQFFSNCRVKNIAEKTVQDIWYQIESFANFAFSKGHSASYAVESYQALYLKAYFPLEYLVATLNNGGGFYRMELYVHEARMHGATIVPPCVNTGSALCTIRGTTVYLGLGLIQALEQELVKRILKERDVNGQFQSLYDFVKRIPVSTEQVSLLIRSGAFRFTGKNKKELLWEAYSIINPVKKPDIETTELFDVAPVNYKLPKLDDFWLDDAFDEIELFGFSLISPFRLLKAELPSQLKARELPELVGKTIAIVGYMVHAKSVTTIKGERMYFGTFIDLDGDWIDTTHFPPSAKAWPFRGPGCYHLIGKVTEEFGFISVEVTEMRRLPGLNREDVKKELANDPGQDVLR